MEPRLKVSLYVVTVISK